jgi:ribosomal protein S18 acetylase RimI-like enzyme
MIMEITVLKKEEIPEAARLYIELVHHLKNNTHDPYLNFDVEPPLENMIAYLESDFNNPLARVYVVKDNAAIVGLSVGRIINCSPPFKEKKVGCLAEAYIKPAYRGKGLMKQIEALLLEFFKQQQVSFVELEVLSTNEIGKKTWTALGYRTFREYMRKRI